MCKLYVYQTGIGPFFIAYSRGRYRAIFENEAIGDFNTVEQAALHLASERRLYVSGGYNPAHFGIPRNLAHWENCLQPTT